MSSLSTLLGLKSSSQNSAVIPSLTFYGPNDQAQIQAVASTGQELAKFIIHGPKKEYTISRINPTPPELLNVASPVYGQNIVPAPMQTTLVGTVKGSSLSDKLKITIHGFEAKQDIDMNSFNGGYIFSPPVESGLGKLKWKSKGSHEYALLDSNKTTIAHGTVSEKKLEVFVTGSELTLDCLMVGWVALQRYKGGSSSETWSAVAEVVGAVAGTG